MNQGAPRTRVGTPTSSEPLLCRQLMPKLVVTYAAADQAPPTATIDDPLINELQVATASASYARFPGYSLVEIGPSAEGTKDVLARHHTREDGGTRRFPLNSHQRDRAPRSRNSRTRDVSNVSANRVGTRQSESSECPWTPALCLRLSKAIGESGVPRRRWAAVAEAFVK
jgi:hypothetical protein